MFSWIEVLDRLLMEMVIKEVTVQAVGVTLERCFLIDHDVGLYLFR